MSFYICDCGQRYHELAALDACQGRRHAGSAERDLEAAFEDLPSVERALAEAVRLRVRAKYRIDPVLEEEPAT